VENGLPRKEGM
jgi:hypothetical protein